MKIVGNLLSLLIFYKRNLTKILPFLIIILFSIFVVIVSTALFSSFTDTVKFYSNSEKMAIIVDYPSKCPNPENLIQRYLIGSTILDIEVNRGYVKLFLGGYTSYLIFGVNKTDLKKLMKYYCVSLKSGRTFIEGKNEIVLSEQIVKNKGYTLGKNIKIDSEKDSNYKLVGTLQGKTAIGFYPYRKDINRKRIFKLVTLNDTLKYNYNNRIELFMKIFYKYREEYKCKFRFSTWDDSRERSINPLKKEIEFLSNISLIISTIVLCLITIFLNIIYFEDRISEYGLLLSLGLNKFQIIKKSFYENFYLISGSWLLGLLLSHIFLKILNWRVFLPKGWFLNTFPIESLPLTIPIPLGMLICGLLVVIYKIKKLDPVEIIERRW